MAQDRYYGISKQAKASNHRWDDARSLFDSRRWRGAMYLAGYAIECLLKHKLMNMYDCRHLDELDEVLRKKNLVRLDEGVFTRKIEVLLKWAGAHDRLRSDRNRWQLFNETNRWKTAWRYSPDLGKPSEAEYFFEAAEATLNWIKNNV